MENAIVQSQSALYSNDHALNTDNGASRLFDDDTKVLQRHGTQHERDLPQVFVSQL